MELREYLAVMRRRLWLLISIPLVAALTAALLSWFVLKPVYQANTTLWVVKQASTTLDYNTFLTDQSLTKTYGEVVKSRAVLQKVIGQLGLTTTFEDLQKQIDVTPVRDTQILGITVKDQDPKRAAAIANAIANTFMGEIKNFIKLDNVSVVDVAVAADKPVSPRKALNTILAFVLGLMVAAGTAFLLETLDVSIRTPADVERHLALPVLGTIPVIADVATEAGQGQAQAKGANKRRRAPAPVATPTADSVTMSAAGGEPK